MSGVVPWCNHNDTEYVCTQCLKCGRCCVCETSAGLAPPLIHKNSKRAAERDREVRRVQKEMQFEKGASAAGKASTSGATSVPVVVLE